MRPSEVENYFRTRRLMEQKAKPLIDWLLEEVMEIEIRGESASDMTLWLAHDHNALPYIASLADGKPLKLFGVPVEICMGMRSQHFELEKKADPTHISPQAQSNPNCQGEK